MKKNQLLVVVGPTASGKTSLAIRLAEYYHTEIISADSRQIYRELNIGTAKPSPAELARVVHHFVDSRSVSEPFDAGMYSREARALIDRLFKDYERIVVSGGSGLYIKAILQGFDELPQVPDGVRSSINQEFAEKGISWLQEEVQTHDPDYFSEVDRQNPQRLIRALEVIRASGKTFSGFQSGSGPSKLPYDVKKIGLELDRTELYKRIDSRMDNMIASGLFEEAEKLAGLSDLNALQTVGYQEIFEFLKGSYSKDEAIRLLKRNSRHYAKRQLTWFKKDKEIRWFDPSDWQGIVNYIELTE